ncbi:SEC-C metal-binding domain-containing protein [Acidaminobacter hydrogenoformans]|nr:SEC-C metal-binding domain-containing protein [Acidaminobacter hydrogenoformans]
MPAPEVLEELMAAVVALQMGTRSWVLKGHRPKDVIKEEVPMVTARAVKRPSAEVFKKHIREARVEKVKIGRNDPCSCGSGKKPKKCCGK